MHSAKSMAFFAIIALIFLNAFNIVYADRPVLDAQCRQCHRDSRHTLTFPSGDEISLKISLDAYDQSPHGANADAPLRCTDCHRPRSNYLFPHKPNQTQSLQEFSNAIAQNCERCHYPHNPFHAIETQQKADLPTCVDCHGDHDITPVDEIPAAMPSACVACHTDQTEDWAIDLIPAREGVGNSPAEGYIGSDRCGGCHEEMYTSWQNTPHAKMIQDVTKDPKVVVGNFTHDDPNLPFGLDDVRYTIGSKWKQRYLTQTDTGDFYILPAQWNVETGEWVPYHADDWQTREWRRTCGSCHVTGLNTETWDFVEFGIGCESCHGPGAEHAADPKNTQLYQDVDDQVCGSCHSRGKSPDGHSFPATYRPGDTLSDHFTATTADADVWADGSAKKHHQQYMDWQLGSKMQQSGKVNCVTCHSTHDDGQADGQLNAPLNDLCLQCHTDKVRLIEHIPYHQQASQKHTFVCSDCHMPKMAKSAVAYDIRNHSFLQPNPDASVAHGGFDAMPNACNTCHTAPAETAQWAAETIAYARIQKPAAGTIALIDTDVPPPPTPIPSVGQKADVESYKVETGRWIRVSFYIVVILLVLWGLYAAYRTITSRRSRNA